MGAPAAETATFVNTLFKLRLVRESLAAALKIPVARWCVNPFSHYVRGNPFARNCACPMPSHEPPCCRQDLPCFCTITVLDWLPVLIEARYVEPVL